MAGIHASNPTSTIIESDVEEHGHGDEYENDHDDGVDHMHELEKALWAMGPEVWRNWCREQDAKDWESIERHAENKNKRKREEEAHEALAKKRKEEARVEREIAAMFLADPWEQWIQAGRQEALQALADAILAM